jgi:hypothetical protein
MDEQLSFNLEFRTSDAVKNVENLQVSIDDLSKVMDDNIKIGADLAKGLVKTAKASGDLTKTISDLAKVMADAVKANEDNTLATNASTRATESAAAAQAKEIEELRGLVVALKETATASRDMAAAQAESAAASQKASAARVESTSLLNKIGNLGTPELMKAAAWSAFAVGGVAYEAIKQYTSFNAVLTQSITQAGRAPSSLPFLSETAMNIAKKTGMHLTDIANIIYRVSSATANWNNGLGASNKQLAQMTQQTANLNVLGGVSGGAPSEQSARIMGAVMNANLKGVGTSAAAASAWVNASVGAGDIKQTEFISAMGRGLLASLAAHNISASSGSAFVDLLTTLGTPGSTAGQYVKTALTLMTAPSAQGSTAMSMIGINVGQLGTLLQQKNGITLAAEYMHQQMKTFNPAATTLPVTEKLANGTNKILTGKAAAEYQLEKWTSGALPQKVIDAWATGKLASYTATQLGTTTAGANGAPVSGAEWQNNLQNLVITKAFGGARSSATMMALLNNPGQVAGIQSYINAHANVATYNKDVAIATNTPQVQFRRIEETLMVSLVKLGKEITPTAINIGKALVDITNWLLKMKIVLVPLVTFIGVIGTLALVSKSARLLGGGISVLGKMSRGLGGLYGKMAGGDVMDESIQRTKLGGFFASLSRGTSAFGTPAEKMNLAADKMLEAAGMGGGASGGNLGKLFKNGEKTALSDTEKALLKEGKNVTKSSVRQALIDAGEIGGAGRSKEAEKLVSSTLGKLQGIQTGALKEVGSVAEKIGTKGIVGLAEKEGGGLLARFAGMGLGDVAGGILGGPIGMIAMATIGPMVMPYIAKGIGGIFHGISGFFGGGGGGGSKTPPVKVAPTGTVALGPLALHAQILGAQADMDRLSGIIASGKAKPTDYAKFYQDQGTIKNAQNQLNLFKGLGTSAASAKVIAANAANLKKWTAQENAVSGASEELKASRAMGYGSDPNALLTYASFRQQVPAVFNKLPTSTQAAIKQLFAEFNDEPGAGKKSKYWNGIGGQPGFLTAVQNVLSATGVQVKKQISQLPANVALANVQNAVKSQLTNDTASKSLLKQATQGNLGIGTASQVYAQLTHASISSALDSSSDTRAAAAQAAAGNLAASKALKEAAATLKAQSIADANAATGVAQKNGLNPQNMSALASAVESSFAKAASSIGLTQNGMAQAFSSALNAPHGGLRGAVLAIIKQGTTGKGL